MFTKEIHYTEDLTIFKDHPNNLRIEERHIAILTKSMQKYGFSKDKPILVDKEMRVLDGRQRLHAAKNAKVGVYWEYSNESIKEQIPIYALNKIWDVDNWIEYRSSLNDPMCISLKRMCEKYNLKFYEACVLCGMSGSDIFEKIKDQTFAFDAEARERLLVNRLRLINNTSDIICRFSTGSVKFLNCISFKKALVRLTITPGFDIDIFLKKLEIAPEKIVKRGTIEEYYKAFVYVYNIRNRNPIKYRN